MMYGKIAKKVTGTLNKQGMIGKVAGYAALAFAGRWIYKKVTKSKYHKTDEQAADSALGYAEEQAADGFSGQAEIIAQQMWGVLNTFVYWENPFEQLIPIVEGLTEEEQYAVYVAFGVRDAVIWGEGDLFAYIAAADAAWWSITGADSDDFYEVFTIGKNNG